MLTKQVSSRILEAGPSGRGTPRALRRQDRRDEEAAVGLGSKIVAGALAVSVLLALAGCGGSAPGAATPVAANGNLAPAATATVTLIATRQASGAPTASVPTGSTPTRAPVAPTAPASQGAKAPAAAATPARPVPALVLKVLEPADESVVTQASLVVRGQTVAGAVVSVDSALAAVDANGGFSAPITLEEGANLIEVVASDNAGNVLSQQILVVFEP